MPKQPRPSGLSSSKRAQKSASALRVVAKEAVADVRPIEGGGGAMQHGREGDGGAIGRFTSEAADAARRGTIQAFAIQSARAARPKNEEGVTEKTLFFFICKRAN